MLDKKLKDMLNNLMELYDLAYNELKLKVSYVIENNIIDVTFIENILDELLNIPTDKCYHLFIKLCDYTSRFDGILAKDYLDLYEELYGENEPKQKKYK